MKNFSKIKLDRNLFKQLGVELVIVFGSQITGNAHSKSDVDIGIVFNNAQKRKKDPVEVYGSLHEDFTKVFKLRHIDIVYLTEVSLALQYKAIRDGVVLYESNQSSFADYKENVLKKYFDFKYVEDIFNEAITKTV